MSELAPYYARGTGIATKLRERDVAEIVELILADESPPLTGRQLWGIVHTLRGVAEQLEAIAADRVRVERGKRPRRVT